MTNQDAIKNISAELATSILKQTEADPPDMEKLHMALQDLKLEIVKKAATLANVSAQFLSGRDVIWNLAQKMPDFEIGSDGHAFLSPLSLGAAVVSGWLLGGVISGFLDFLSMGGDILRPLCIFLFIWVEQYLVSNSKARKKFLKYLGLVTLGSFAARTGMGFLRFGSGFGTFLGKGSGFLKSIWLIFGALFIMIFLRGKSVKPDLVKLKLHLEENIAARITFLYFIFKQWRDLEQKHELLLQENDSRSYASRQEKELTDSLFQIMNTLDPSVKNFLENKLRKMGIEQEDRDSSFIVWNNERDPELYESQGFIKNGDKALILRKPWKKGDSITKGIVRRLTE